MTETKLRGMAYPGQFPSELIVIVQSHNGRSYSLFSSRSDVTLDMPPSEGNPVDCLLRVHIVKRDRELFLVRLPQSTLENGQFITVTSDQLANVQNYCEV